MDATPEALEQKITWAREAARERFADLELGILVAQVFTTEDREQAAQFIATTLAAGLNVSTDLILQAPYLLVGLYHTIAPSLNYSLSLCDNYYSISTVCMLRLG